MQKRALSILVENHAGVLSRVVGLFSRRGYNIDSLSVGETENPQISRITVVVSADESIFEQVRKQVGKLVDVIDIIELKPDNTVFRELVLLKVCADMKTRASIIEIADIFRAKIVDVTPASLTIEMTGNLSKINAFLELLSPYGVIEITRTGVTGLSRGSKSIKDY